MLQSLPSTCHDRRASRDIHTMRPWITVMLALIACQRASAVQVDPPPAVVTTQTTTPHLVEVPDASTLAPLTGHEWLEPVGDDARELAKVSIPENVTTRRPLMIALHGAADRSEWACAEWRGITHDVPFIVCPRGDRTGMYWGTPQSTLDDIRLANIEVHSRFDGYVHERGPEVLAGFSMGASQAVGLLTTTDLRVPSVALVEGGYDSLAIEGIPALLATRGVKRVLLGCTTLGRCPKRYSDAKRELERSGIDVHFVQAGSAAHGLYADSIEALAKEMPWLTTGLEGFAPDP